MCTGAECRRRESAGQARRLAVTGTRLCLTCRERLVQVLGRLPALYEECARRIDGSSNGVREKTSGGALPGMPLNTAALEVRSSILAVLSSWAAVVAEQRRVPGPRRTVPLLTAFLRRHADWLVTHEAAGELSQEVARLARGAWRVIDPGPQRRVTIGDCVEHGCPGGLTAVVRPDRPAVPAEISCDASPEHHWLGHQWLQLSRRLGARAALTAPGEDTGGIRADRHETGEPEAQPVTWFTAADVARLWSIPSGTVYRHASQQKWRRHSKQGRTYYHHADVLRTLSALRRSP
ncbi:MerR family transcriptional regulator [Streptomyces narbonensis]|uniref:helix-turn-helix domain-containing protein n=1 Tax=Streptomyces narbonensis TaxID=67333 RepID=UPI0016770E66|nr:helix-turn-helix domain-containing protein [Streptomyces narbonensis]GGW11907.1 hypothetical protein GCM10010230_66240 [Streptomyces narbonensis]